MKIGIDARMYSSNFTGIGRYVYELAQNLFAIDKKNEYVLFFNEPEYSRFACPHQKVCKKLAGAPHYSLKEQISFLKLLNEEKLDLMHFTHFNAPIGYRRPFVVTIHDLTLSFFPGKKMTSFLHRTGYHLSIRNAVKKSCKIIAVSENTKKDLQQLFKIPESKIAVIYEAVNPEFQKITDSTQFKKMTENIKFFQNPPGKNAKEKAFLLYTGVWRDHKNIVNLIRAFQILKEKYQFNGLLLITGRENPFYPEIKETVAQLKLEKNVVFTGLVSEEELVALYNRAACYVLPSLYEGFGLPILEAFACETPVACSNSSSLPEIAGAGNALFFDPLNPENIAETIHKILINPDLRQQLIERGRQRVKDFSWRKMAEETLKIYEECL